jgi:hypothetical protein
MTMAILFIAVFLLGFVADPIINLYMDPWSFLNPWSREMLYFSPEDRPTTWSEHFGKGFAGMGVIGFLKVIVASPFSYFRIGGARRRGRGTTGRERVEQVGWLIIVIGVFTFLGVSSRLYFRFSPESVADKHRRFTKEYEPGAGECSRKPANESWTCNKTTTMTTSRTELLPGYASLNRL